MFTITYSKENILQTTTGNNTAIIFLLGNIQCQFCINDADIFCRYHDNVNFEGLNRQ
jgi:hypothetical protein